MDTAMGMVLLSDPEVAGIPVVECGEPLVDLRTVGALRLDSRLADPQGSYARLRVGVVDRLVTAQTLLPVGLRLLIVEGYRPIALQRQYFEAHVDRLRANDPWADEADLRRRASAYVAPPEVAPHVAGAAVDLTLCTVDGAELPMGTEVNDTDTNCAVINHAVINHAAADEAASNQAVSNRVGAGRARANDEGASAGGSQARTDEAVSNHAEAGRAGASRAEAGRAGASRAAAGLGGAGREGARREGARREGARREGARREGARREGARREGADLGITRACHTASAGIDTSARENRRLLSAALSGAGLINYPSEWWHWSYGDRYWAFATKAGNACYGPV